MTDISIRVEGRAGRITLQRPRALNAMTYDMCMAIDAGLRTWRDDRGVDVIVVDAEGDKAFCAGGDIAELYATGTRGDFDYGRRFWRDEYRMNAMMASYPKPIVTLMQGYTMGGGVGVGCHASHRIVGNSSRIAMPECGIGLVPDVGGSHLLARLETVVPGLGAYAGTTGLRLDHRLAVLGFADRFLPEDTWDALKSEAVETGRPPVHDLPAEADRNRADIRDDIRAVAGHFREGRPAEILESLRGDAREVAQTAVAALEQACPLSVACHLEILRRISPDDPIERALELEYRFTWRSMERGDFLEGIRAQIIEKDRTPRWSHASLADVTQTEVDAMLAPLGDDTLAFND